MKWWRPDTEFAKDLEWMGFDGEKPPIVSVSEVEFLLATVSNQGTKDTELVEIKAPVVGALRYGQFDVSQVTKAVGALRYGQFDGSQVTKAALENRTDKRLSPNRYESVGAIRVGDTPLIVALFCQHLPDFTFRYKDGDSTRIVQYIVKPDYSLSQVVFWGMDWDRLKVVSVRWAIALIACVPIYLFRERIGLVAAKTFGRRTLEAPVRQNKNSPKKAKQRRRGKRQRR